MQTTEAPPRKGPNPFAKRKYGELQKITDRVYLFRNIVNSGVIITPDGVAVVDTQINEPMARRMVAAIREITDAPIRYAINTHYHWDHWAGNDVFRAEGARIVGNVLTREFMEVRNVRQRRFLKSRGFSMPDHDPSYPELTYDGELTLRLGDFPIHLSHIGRAETDDPTMVWLPEERIAVSGDTLMTGSFPILGQPVMNEGMSENRAWIRTLEKLKSFDPVHVIPGHGPLGGIPEIDFFIRLQEYFLTEVRIRVGQGKSQSEIIREIESALPELYANMPVTWGTPRYAILRAIQSMTGWQHLKPTAIPQPDRESLAGGLAGLEGTGDVYIEAARRFAKEKRYDLALGIIEEGAQKYPGDPAVWTERGKLLVEASRSPASVLEKGDFFIEARRSIDKALEAEPGFGPALLFLGSYMVQGAYRNGDDPAEGMALLQKALAAPLTDPELAQVHFALGLGHRTNGEEEKAAAAFREALALDPSCMPARMALNG